jgi:predicted DCC family thiol-disulfide oxidoreductase YuxK
MPNTKAISAENIEPKATEDAADAPLTVFYDGACPVCTIEVGAYQRCRGGERINWVDLSAAPPGEVAPGLSRDEALRRFTVMRADGSLSRGGSAFADLWASLPALRFVGRMAQTWPLSAIADGAYRFVFLPIRPGLQWLVRRFRPADGKR